MRRILAVAFAPSPGEAFRGFSLAATDKGWQSFEFVLLEYPGPWCVGADTPSTAKLRVPWLRGAWVGNGQAHGWSEARKLYAVTLAATRLPSSPS